MLIAHVIYYAIDHFIVYLCICVHYIPGSILEDDYDVDYIPNLLLEDGYDVDYWPGSILEDDYDVDYIIGSILEDDIDNIPNSNLEDDYDVYYIPGPILKDNLILFICPVQFQRIAMTMMIILTDSSVDIFYEIIRHDIWWLVDKRYLNGKWWLVDKRCLVDK